MTAGKIVCSENAKPPTPEGAVKNREIVSRETVSFEIAKPHPSAFTGKQYFFHKNNSPFCVRFYVKFS